MEEEAQSIQQGRVVTVQRHTQHNVTQQQVYQTTPYPRITLDLNTLYTGSIKTGTQVSLINTSLYTVHVRIDSVKIKIRATVCIECRPIVQVECWGQRQFVCCPALELKLIECWSD